MKNSDNENQNPSSGSLGSQKTPELEPATERFIKGLRLAASKGEAVNFH